MKPRVRLSPIGTRCEPMGLNAMTGQNDIRKALPVQCILAEEVQCSIAAGFIPQKLPYHILCLLVGLNHMEVRAAIVLDVLVVREFRYRINLKILRCHLHQWQA